MNDLLAGNGAKLDVIAGLLANVVEFMTAAKQQKAAAKVCVGNSMLK